MALQTCVIAPDRVLWDGPIDEALFSATSGSLGVLEGHAPLLTALDIGPMRLRAGSWVSFAVMGGFATVQKGCLTVIVNEAYRGDELVLFSYVLDSFGFESFSALRSFVVLQYI